MRRAPGKRLHVDANTRVGPFELRNECGDHFAFPAHGPEANDVAIARRRSAGRREQGHRERREARTKGTEEGPRRGPVQGVAAAVAAGDGVAGPAVVVSHPPEKPARSKPRRMCRLRFITRHTKPVR